MEQKPLPFLPLSELVKMDKKVLANQKVLTLLVHYRSTPDQALDLVRNSDTSIPLADYFHDPNLKKQYGTVENLSEFRFHKKYLGDEDVEMLTTLLPGIESLELVILSQLLFSEEQANLFALLFTSNNFNWAKRIKSLKIWAKAAIEEKVKEKKSEEDDEEMKESEDGKVKKEETERISKLDEAVFDPLQRFKALKHLTLDVWEFPAISENFTLFPENLNDVRMIVDNESHWKTVKEFTFGSRNNCTNMWLSVFEIEAIESEDLKSLQVPVPLGRPFESFDLPSCLKKLNEENNWLGKRFHMVGVVVSNQAQFEAMLNAFPALTRLTVELATGATLDESDVVNLIAARKYKLIDLRIYTSTAVQLTKPFSKPTQPLPDVVSLTLGTFQTGLFEFKSDKKSHEKSIKRGKIDLTQVKKVVPNCRGLVLRLESPFYECGSCNNRNQHFQLSLKQSNLGLRDDFGKDNCKIPEKDRFDVVRIDFAKFDQSNEDGTSMAGQECIVYNKLGKVNCKKSKPLGATKKGPKSSKGTAAQLKSDKPKASPDKPKANPDKPKVSPGKPKASPGKPKQSPGNKPKGSPKQDKKSPQKK